MDFADLDELHYITHGDNIDSILRHGIVCYRRAARLPHRSVAMDEIQDRRAKVRVPTPDGSRPLHSYANLFFSARNPMLYKRLGQRDTLCVVRVSKDVLLMPGVVVTDCNASSDWVQFGAGVNGLRIVDRELVFADDWRSQDQIQYFRQRSAKCAEVLVPDVVPTEFLSGLYVSSDESARGMRQSVRLPSGFRVEVNRHLFFL